MEDWQEWQIRADQVAAALQDEVTGLDRTFFGDETDASLRGFWPRFRDLKERVRTAPAIKLEDKLDLERRLRTLGNRAYKAQESTYAHSGERKTEILQSIEGFRSSAEALTAPRDLRTLRRDLDRVREQFDAGAQLVPADRQAVWEAWRSANQFVWDRLTAGWSENETYLRELLNSARQELTSSNANAARQGVARFFDALRTRESKQETMNLLKAEAESIRREADQQETRKVATRAASQQAQYVPAIDTWRADLERAREGMARLQEEIAALSVQFDSADSVLAQAMVRGTLVEKKRKLAEYQRSNRTLERRIEQAEETSVLSVG